MAVSECDDFSSGDPSQDQHQGRSLWSQVPLRVLRPLYLVTATTAEIFGGPRGWQLNDVQRAVLQPEAEVLRT